ncbi:MAG: hypothetical protein M9890_13515, partial [Thermomicrobiales bacterium]|nr:hypothetical protein [Thermomicrobiales bacterium]
QHYYAWRSGLTPPAEPTPTSTTAPGEPTNTPQPTNTTAPGEPTNTPQATNTSVPATNTTVPATSTTVPATNTAVPTGYLNVNVVGPDGSIELPDGTTINSHNVKIYAGSTCTGTVIKTLTLDLSTFSLVTSVDAGTYCAQLNASVSVLFGGTIYNGTVHATGTGTVVANDPADNENITITIDAGSISIP